MRGFFSFGLKGRSFIEWSKFLGFTGALKLFSSAGFLIPVATSILSVLFLSFLLSVVFPGCNGLTFEEPVKGELVLQFSKEVITKSVIREFPDSNKFILTIKNSSGGTEYSGAYGERPAKLELNAGSYDITVVSRTFLKPEFDAPCYSDNKTVVVEAGKKCIISLTARQSNVGLRLSFTSDFISHFSDYIPEITDSKGSLDYPYTETRFAYLNPGKISLKLRQVLPAGSTAVADTIPIAEREMVAKDMLTINLHANPSDTDSSKSGIFIDTTSNWVFEYIIIGGGGDGLTKGTAYSVDRLSANIGAKGVWVTGYIVGGDLTSSAISFEAPFTKETNLAIAASPTVKDRSKCFSVSIPNTDIRTALNLSTNPGNLGKRVYIKGTIVASYLGLVGLNPITEAEF